MEKPYAHQQVIIDADPKKWGLWLGTGSGKTRTALLLATGRTLVICPKMQKEDRNWEREFEKIRGMKTTSEREIEVTDDGVFHHQLTMSKETFRRDADHVPVMETLIVDEAHTCLGVTPNVRYRNKQPIPKASQLFEALDRYVRTAKPKRLYLLTATILKSPMCVWAAEKLFGIHDGSIQNFYQFRHEFYTKLPMPGREVWVAKNDTESKNKLAVRVKRMGSVGRLEDFFDVPEQTFRTVHVELNAEQKRRIKELQIEYPDPIVRIGKRHQVENGSLKGNEFAPAEHFESAKIDLIVDYAAEFPRMVIFVKYIAQMMQIHHALSNAGYTSWIMDGQTKDRGEVIKHAQDNDGILIAQAQISQGWELPDTPVAIFASRTYSYVDYVQAQGRILRANRLKKNLYINLVVKGGIDEAVDKSLANKQDFDEKLYADRT